MTPEKIENTFEVKPYTIENHHIKLYQAPEVWLPYSASNMLSFLIQGRYLDQIAGQSILDLGTGSGIIGIVCGFFGPSKVILSDYCKAAADIAQKNAFLNGVVAQGVQSDRFESLQGQKFNFIISNPPVQPWLFTDSQLQEDRISAAAWNEAGSNGRLVLDSIIKDSKSFLHSFGEVITSCSSRHGHIHTIKLLDQYWPNSWEEIFVSEHFVDSGYHQPYMDIWKKLQEQDLDLRVYQKDDQSRRFTFQQDAQGDFFWITEINFLNKLIPVKIYKDLDKARVFNQQGEKILDLSAEDTLVPGYPIDDTWYYTYHLLRLCCGEEKGGRNSH